MAEGNLERFGKGAAEGSGELNLLQISEHAGKLSKPPYPAWSQRDCNGKPASTAAGNDMEAIALSHLGQRIDDGYGADGCTAAIANHILRSHLERIGKAAEFPQSGIADTKTLIAWAKRHPELCTISQIPQKALKASALQPGDIIVGEKSDGDHCMIATRFPASWNLSANDIALLGNTGHPEWVADGPPYPHFRMQEIVGDRADEKAIGTDHGGPESGSASNPYNLPDAKWVVIRLKQ